METSNPTLNIYIPESYIMTAEEMSNSFNYKVDKREMLTDVFPIGTTILYGESGAGKTTSTIRNLNRHKIKPILLDFDRNNFLSGDFVHLDGYRFIDYLMDKNNENISLLKKHKVRLEKMQHILIDIYDKNISTEDNPFLGFLPHELQKAVELYLSRYKDLVNTKQHEDFMLNYKFLMTDIFENVTSEDLIASEQTYILDTYKMCIEYMKNDNRTFKNLIKLITKRAKSNLIIISHEVGERGEHSELNYVLENHSDGKMRLKRDVTKTKGEEVYLLIQKSRGYNGVKNIKNWERN